MVTNKKFFLRKLIFLFVTTDCYYEYLLNIKVYDIRTLKAMDDESQAVIAFSAIAQPEQFYKYLRRYDVLATKDFPDHHIYTKQAPSADDKV